MSADVNASEIMQNMVMNDDDKEWYAKLFKKQAKNFLKPRFTVQHGFDVGLSAGLVRPGGVLREVGLDHRTSSYGVFITVPPGIVRQLEALYPRLAMRSEVDDSPAHVTVLYVGDLDGCQAEHLRKTCETVMRQFQPFSVSICGTGHFMNEDQSVFHARVVSDRLTELHHVLRASLETAGIPVGHSYGSGDDTYRGHVTLAYLPPGQQEPDLRVEGSWVVDRVEVWNMGSPVSFKLGSSPCLGCAVGLCRTHVTEAVKRSKKKGDEDDLILEPDSADRKGRPRKKEVSAIGVAANGTGASVRGYNPPLSGNQRKMRKRAAQLNARSFGGAKP